MSEKLTPAEKAKAFQMEINENKICSVVGRCLEQHYPGYMWNVECTWYTGCVTVKCLDIHGDYGFIIHLKDLVHDIGLQLPMKAGGELLERCGLPRSKRPEKLELKRDIRGNVAKTSADLTVFGGHN